MLETFLALGEPNRLRIVELLRDARERFGQLDHVLIDVQIEEKTRGRVARS